ncbi:MAG TPA: DHHA1 domain-containing protein [Tissierellaceae bacterium]|nr:DHHA1 domain-containing protein [Tissierellaceae bacterium]
MTTKFYLDNPYVREIEGRIVDKAYRNGKYYLKLNRTIFYPHLSGGQPGDIGTINGVPLEEVYEEGKDIIHVVSKNIHSNKVTLNIDWKNRLDNMQQHTGQHLLSASFYKLYNGETIGFHLGKDYVYIDVDLPSLTDEEAKRIEIFANKIITSNFEIKAYYAKNNEIEKIPVRKKPTVKSNIRIVEIDNIDFSPCAGTHLRNTGEIGLIKIRKWESYKENIRVEFICGNRAFLDYSWKNQAINDISLLLSSKDQDSYEKVKLIYDQKNELEKENRNLKEEVNKYEAKEIFESAFKIREISYISRMFENKELKEINYIANYLSKNNNLVQIYGLKDNNEGLFLINVSKNLDVNLKDILRDLSTKFHIKGGGTKNNIQGKVSLDKLEEIMTRFFESIKG